jgi:hypothetical protein
MLPPAAASACFVCAPLLLHYSTVADAEAQQLGRSQLSLACAADDMGSFVEIELGSDRQAPPRPAYARLMSPDSKRRLCAGGRSGASFSGVQSQDLRRRCGVFTG